MARGPSPLLGYNTNIRHKGKVYHVQTEDSGVGHPHVITHLFADGGRIVDSRKTEYTEHVGADGLQEIVKKLMQTQHKAMCIALRDGAYDAGEAAAAYAASGAVAAQAEGGADGDAPDASATVASPAAARAAQKARKSKAPGHRRSKGPPASRKSQSPRATLAYEEGDGPSTPESEAPAKQSTSQRPSRAPKKRASKAPPRPQDAVEEPVSDEAAFERAAEQRLAESNLTRAPVRRRPASTPLGRMKPRKRPSSDKELDDVILDYLDQNKKKEGG